MYSGENKGESGYFYKGDVMTEPFTLIKRECVFCKEEEEKEQLKAQLKIAVSALELISKQQGMTLLGEFCNSDDKEYDRQHQIGANKAYDQTAGIATQALKKMEGGV